MMTGGQLGAENFAAAAYRERAADYVASATHSEGADLEQIEAIFQGGRKFGRVLDLGCGGGHVAYRVAPQVAEVVACDVTSTMLQQVAHEALARGLVNVTTSLAAAESLPFAQGEFDAVLTRYSAHHWQDWNEGLREMRRVMAAGGVAVFADVIAPADPLVDSYLQTIEVLRDASHVRNYTLAQWVTALGQAGFALHAVTPRRLPIDFRSWIARTRTNDLHRDAVLSVMAAAPRSVRAALEISLTGSFVLDTVTIIAGAG